MVWNLNQSYVVATVAGSNGKTAISQTVASEFEPPSQADGLSCDTRGATGNFAIGQVFDLTGGQNGGGVKLDLRPGIGFTKSGCEMPVRDEGVLKPNYSSVNASLSAMVFSNLPMANGFLTPYLQSTVKHQFAYKNAVDNIGRPQFFEGIPLDTKEFTTFEQSHSHLESELGVNYTSGNISFGAAAYYSVSSDEQTVGGRLGLTIRTN